MGNFCPNCGRPLNEGEVCDCTQKSNVREDETDMQKKSELKNNLQYRIKEGVVPKLLVPIGQTVIGGILVLFALICGGVDWGYISFISGAGFLLTGICALIEIQSNKK